MMRPLCIGIVACSAEGAALCYRTICAEAPAILGPHAHPDVCLHGHSLARYVELLERDDWDGIAELMLSSASALARAGAQLLICPDNTIHRAFARVVARSPLPWLHIAEIVARHAAERGFARVGVLGTRWLVGGEVYPEQLAAHGVQCVRPKPGERDAIDRIIMSELVPGVVSPESQAYCASVIDRMKDEEGCDAVALACTELPLLLTGAYDGLPMLDSTRLLARAALSRAVAGQQLPPGSR